MKTHKSVIRAGKYVNGLRESAVEMNKPMIEVNKYDGNKKDSY